MSFVSIIPPVLQTHTNLTYTKEDTVNKTLLFYKNTGGLRIT